MPCPSRFAVISFSSLPSLACTTGSQPFSNFLCDCCRGRSAPIGAWWFVGVSSGGGTPGPFSNPAVKPACAAGTWLATAWERRSSPTSLLLAPASVFSLPHHPFPALPILHLAPRALSLSLPIRLTCILNRLPKIVTPLSFLQ